MTASKPLTAAQRMQKMRNKRKAEGRCPECGMKRRRPAKQKEPRE